MEFLIHGMCSMERKRTFGLGLYLLLLCNTIHNVVSLEGQCESVAMSFPDSPQTGQTMVGFVYRTASTIPNVQLCAKECILHRICRSINYDGHSGVCELNSEDHVSRPTSLSAAIPSTSQYYGIDGWPELLLGGCRDHTCPDTHTCEIMTNGLYPTYQCVVSSYVPEMTTPIQPTTGCTHVLPPISEIVVDSVTVRYSPVTCVRSVRTLGNPNALAILLKSYRSDPNFDWYDMTPVIEGCAHEAYVASYPYFGIEYYGECWADQVFVESAHTKVQAEQCATDTYLGVGGNFVMCIFQIV